MTTQTKHSSSIDRAINILQSIQRKIKNDNATKANLKRALSGDPRHLRAIYPVILPYLTENEEKYHFEQWLLVISLLAFYPSDIETDNSFNFGISSRRLMGDGSSDGPERRFRALLDTSLDDLRSPLTSMVRLMKAKNISINYPQLLVDLCRWNHPDQYIQDKWARAFWNAPRLNSDISEEEDAMT
jgi:CRISPR system Cascade subunit CasB